MIRALILLIVIAFLLYINAKEYKTTHKKSNLALLIVSVIMLLAEIVIIIGNAAIGG